MRCLMKEGCLISAGHLPRGRQCSETVVSFHVAISLTAERMVPLRHSCEAEEIVERAMCKGHLGRRGSCLSAVGPSAVHLRVALQRECKAQGEGGGVGLQPYGSTRRCWYKNVDLFRLPSKILSPSFREKPKPHQAITLVPLTPPVSCFLCCSAPHSPWFS